MSDAVASATRPNVAPLPVDAGANTSMNSTETEHSTGPLRKFAHLVRQTVPPMHPAGRPFVIGSGLITVLLYRLRRPAGVLGMVATAWCAWFFREPKRTTPTRDGIAVAPADGTISSIEKATPPPELELGDTPMRRVSVFLTVFDVHVQRNPISGEVADIAYRPGAFLSADLDKASEDNERNSMLLRGDDGREIVVVQIAGLVARRIVCDVHQGQRVDAGETYGLIRFGSRVDLYVPVDSRIPVEVGQRTIGGETVLAEFTDTNGATR